MKRTIKKRNFMNGRIYLEMVKFVYMIGKAATLKSKTEREMEEKSKYSIVFRSTLKFLD